MALSKPGGVSAAQENHINLHKQWFVYSSNRIKLYCQSKIRTLPQGSHLTSLFIN